MTGDVKWNDGLQRESLGMSVLGSAHPLPDPRSTGSGNECQIGLHSQQGLLSHSVLLYRVCDDAPTTRHVVAKHTTGSQLPYFHSFGLSQSYAVLPLQHLSIDLLSVLGTGTVLPAFKVRARRHA